MEIREFPQPPDLKLTQELQVLLAHRALRVIPELLKLLALRETQVHKELLDLPVHRDQPVLSAQPAPRGT